MKTRRRKTANSSDFKTTDEQNRLREKTAQGDEPTAVDPQSSTWSEPLRFLRNCFIITLVVIIPYGISLFQKWYHLKSAIVRPVVHLDDTRQVLIFGLQGSGTTATSISLNGIGMEVGHETSDATDAFCRDGTISWAHGIQALNEEKFWKENMATEICRAPRFRILHSTQFEESRSCSYRREWDACWSKECERVLKKNYGCLHRDTNCETKFHRYILHVRHPLNNVASLVVKFCPTFDYDALPAANFLLVLNAFYPSIDWSTIKGGCIGIFSRYWYEYNSRMLQVTSRFYRVEDTSPCAIARLSGFMDKESTAYPGTIEKITKSCDGERKQIKAKASKRFWKIASGKVNRVNQGRLNVSYADIEKLDPELVIKIKNLAHKTFGYID